MKLLLDEEVSIGGVNFFGGTMWTDFSGGDLRATETAQDQMNDSRVIGNPDQTHFSSADAVALHKKLRVESAEMVWQGPKRSARGYQP